MAIRPYAKFYRFEIQFIWPFSTCPSAMGSDIGRWVLASARMTMDNSCASGWNPAVAGDILRPNHQYFSVTPLSPHPASQFPIQFALGFIPRGIIEGLEVRKLMAACRSEWAAVERGFLWRMTGWISSIGQ